MAERGKAPTRALYSVSETMFHSKGIALSNSLASAMITSDPCSLVLSSLALLPLRFHPSLVQPLSCATSFSRTTSISCHCARVTTSSCTFRNLENTNVSTNQAHGAKLQSKDLSAKIIPVPLTHRTIQTFLCIEILSVPSARCIKNGDDHHEIPRRLHRPTTTQTPQTPQTRKEVHRSQEELPYIDAFGKLLTVIEHSLSHWWDGLVWFADAECLLTSTDDEATSWIRRVAPRGLFAWSAESWQKTSFM